MQILLIDDDIILSGMLKEYLDAEQFITTTVATGEAGIAAALSGDFDALILDVMLPDISGVDVLSKIRQSSNIPVIMLTAKGDNIDRIVGLELGADDYVTKPYDARELLARLRAVLRRSYNDAPKQQSNNILSMGALHLFKKQHRVEWQGQPLELTTTEFSILEMLLANQDRIVTKDELSERIMGRRREIYDRSIDVHVSNLRLKLAQVVNQKIIIETVRGVGHRLRET
ncbi:MAG: response regulator transcription factor [Taibaiella sp.]|jgi:two-component system OmpR family response regulator